MGDVGPNRSNTSEPSRRATRSGGLLHVRKEVIQHEGKDVDEKVKVD